MNKKYNKDNIYVMNVKKNFLIILNYKDILEKYIKI